jgi:hypothetical protein
MAPFQTPIEVVAAGELGRLQRICVRAQMLRGF